MNKDACTYKTITQVTSFTEFILRQVITNLVQVVKYLSQYTHTSRDHL